MVIVWRGYELRALATDRNICFWLGLLISFLGGLKSTGGTCVPNLSLTLALRPKASMRCGAATGISRSIGPVVLIFSGVNQVESETVDTGLGSIIGGLALQHMFELSDPELSTAGDVTIRLTAIPSFHIVLPQNSSTSRRNGEGLNALASHKESLPCTTLEFGGVLD